MKNAELSGTNMRVHSTVLILIDHKFLLVFCTFVYGHMSYLVQYYSTLCGKFPMTSCWLFCSLNVVIEVWLILIYHHSYDTASLLQLGLHPSWYNPCLPTFLLYWMRWWWVSCSSTWSSKRVRAFLIQAEVPLATHTLFGLDKKTWSFFPGKYSKGHTCYCYRNKRDSLLLMYW